jgi:hypothetical protein
MIKEHYPLIDSLLAKLRGKEPYVGWFELLMMHMQRKLILLTTHMQRKLMLLKQEEREKNEESGWQKITEGAFIKYSNENYTFYWPSSFAASDPVSQFHCIEKGNPHSYFDFYDPADGDVIFDIGACEGFFALELFRRNSSVKIYAAEPVEQLCGALRKTFDNRLEVIQKAFSSSKGKKRFSVANALTHCSSFIESPGIQEPVGGGGVLCPCKFTFRQKTIF